MSETEYNQLGEATSVWFCQTCGLRNISTSLFKSRRHSSASTTYSFGSVNSPGEPLHMSSPNRKPPKVKGKPALNIINVNCQRVSAKRLPFETMVSRVKPDIVKGTESWLHANIGNQTVFPVDQYQVFRRDREKNNKKGGVFILARKDLTITREEELETDCELLWCKVHIHGARNLHVGAYYRPHEQDEDSLTELEKTLDRLHEYNDLIILGGDFNFPGWDWQNNCTKPQCHYPALHNRFASLLDNSGLSRMVEEPTREDNILDLICTNLPSKINKAWVIPGISDHCIPTAEVDIQPIQRRQRPRTIQLYKKADWDQMAKEMGAVKHQIEEQKHTKTANELWLMFKNAVADAAAKYIPSKTCKSREQLPYMTRELVKLIRKRDRIYKKRQRAKRNFECSTAGYQNTDKKLRDIKKEIQKKLRQAYWNYIESIITPMDDNTEQISGMKRFWQFVKSRRKDHTGIATLKVNGILALNTQFESEFNKVGVVPDDLMPDSPHPSATDIEITTPGVQKMMERLKVHKAAGPDGIGPMILKTLAPSIAPILIIIYQRSYDTGLIPDDWRNANVAPVYKKGKSSAPSNYRPISLTCIACKLMEHIVTSHIMRHASRHNLLYKLQHGFRDKRSCETQLIEFQADALQNMTDGSQTDILIMDSSKAFDKVSHKHLMEKLKFYGIRGKCTTWISDFLTDRTKQ